MASFISASMTMSRTPSASEDSITQLATRVRQLERRLCALLVVSLTLGVTAAKASSSPQDVLRVRGLVVVDAEGRERIVLGAPMGDASKNGKLANAVGLAVLDSAGKLHVALGANNPLVFRTGQLGTRTAQEAGLTIYDPRTGGERGGMGAFANGAANICLDYGTKDKEGACLSIAPDDQYAAVILNANPRYPQYDVATMFAGADGSASLKAFGAGQNTDGVMIRAGKGRARITVYDTSGKSPEELVRTP